MSHWTGRHSIPCIEPIEECQGHMDGLPERWRAYAMVLLQPTEQKVFWELPKETFNSIMAFVGKGNCWRGHRVLVIRGMGEKAHMRLEFQAAWDLTTKRPLPGATSVTETLNVLYDLQERKRKKQS